MKRFPDWRRNTGDGSNVSDRVRERVDEDRNLRIDSPPRKLLRRRFLSPREKIRTSGSRQRERKRPRRGTAPIRERARAYGMIYKAVDRGK